MLVRQRMSRGIIGPNGAAKAHAMQFRISLSYPKVVRADDVSVHGPLRLSGRQRGLRVWKCRPEEPGLVVCDCGRWPGPHYRLERAKSA